MQHFVNFMSVNIFGCLSLWVVLGDNERKDERIVHSVGQVRRIYTLTSSSHYTNGRKSVFLHRIFSFTHSILFSFFAAFVTVTIIYDFLARITYISVTSYAPFKCISFITLPFIIQSVNLLHISRLRYSLLSPPLLPFFLSLSILNLWLLQFKILNLLPGLIILNTSLALPLRAESNVWSSLKGNWFTTCFFKRKEKNSFQHFNEYHSLQKVLKRSRFPFFLYISLSLSLSFLLLFSSPFQPPFSHFFPWSVGKLILKSERRYQNIFSNIFEYIL